MFEATAALGGLDVQLVYYRGFNECKASRWLTSAADLHRVMRSVSCVGGETQIERVLDHAIRETGNRQGRRARCLSATRWRRSSTGCAAWPASSARWVCRSSCFTKVMTPTAEAAFRQMATLSRGAYLAFDLAGIARLKELLGAVAVFATGNRAALAAHGQKKGGEVLRLTAQMKR